MVVPTRKPEAGGFHLHRITTANGVRRLEYHYELRGRTYARIRLVGRNGTTICVFDKPLGAAEQGRG